MNLFKLVQNYGDMEKIKLEIVKEFSITPFKAKSLLNDYFFRFTKNENPIEMRAFLKFLVKFLPLNKEKGMRKIEEFEKLVKIRKRELPYIYVDTQFKHKNSPVFAKVAMESRHKRRFNLEYNLSDSEIKEFIINHFELNKGKLEFWGKINHYVYYDLNDCITVYNCNGKKIETESFQGESRCSISV